MRRIELSTALPAHADRAWAVFVDTERWRGWGRLVTAAQGERVPGAVWTMTLRGLDGGPPRTMTPRLLSWEPPRAITFETVLGHRRLVRLTHAFVFEPDGPYRSRLRQTFDATGAAVGLVWGPLSRGMTQFSDLGDDLAARLAAT